MLTDVLRKQPFLAAIVMVGFTLGAASAQVMAKAQVANLIVKVENGVDQFKDYLERRGDNARNAQSSPQGDARRARRGQATESQKATAAARKDDLEDSLGDIDRSTNRLRRKFDATDKWMETKVQVQAVVDDGRKINQALTRGNYGAEAARLWAVLRNGINDLARVYGVAPLGV